MWRRPTPRSATAAPRRRAARRGGACRAPRPGSRSGNSSSDDDRGECELGAGEDPRQGLEQDERPDAPARGGEPREDSVPEQPDEQERPAPDAVGEPDGEEGDERPGRDRDVGEPECSGADVEGVLELRGQQPTEVAVVAVEEGGGDEQEEKDAKVPLRSLLDRHWGITLVRAQVAGWPRSRRGTVPGSLPAEAVGTPRDQCPW